MFYAMYVPYSIILLERVHSALIIDMQETRVS